MDKNLVYAISVIVCALLQLAIAPAVALFGATPNFLIIPVLFIALRSGAVAASVAGFALGLHIAQGLGRADSQSDDGHEGEENAFHGKGILLAAGGARGVARRR